MIGRSCATTYDLPYHPTSFDLYLWDTLYILLIILLLYSLRTNCDWLRSQYPICGTGENQGRAELFPARWRAGERGDAAELLAAAAPMGAPALRRAINDAAMDVMYYTSPVYGKQV